MVRADALTRVDHASALRVAGHTWAEVAHEAGYSHATNACRAVGRAFDRLPSPDREQSAALWRLRIDWLFHQARLDVLDRKPGAVVACARVISLGLRMDGLETTRHEVEVNPSEAELRAWVDKMLSMQRRNLPTEFDKLEGAAGDWD